MGEDDSREYLLKKIERLEKENDSLRNLLQKRDALHSDKTDSHTRNKFDKEKYAAKILDSLPDMLSVLTPDGTLVEVVSSEETNHIGEPNALLAGRDISSLLPDEAYRNIKRNLDRVVTTGERSTSHHTLYTNGQNRFYENRIFPLDDRYMICMCRDITEAMLAKNALEVTNKKMQIAEKIAGLSYWYYYGATQEIEAPGIVPLLPGMGDANHRCSRDLYLSYVHPDDREMLEQQFFRLDSSNEYTEHRLCIQGKNRYLHTKIIRVYEERGSRIVEGYVQDMTYMVERMHELENVRYAVNNAQQEIYACRLDGTFDFANRKFTARHALKTPLRDVRIYDSVSFMRDKQEWLAKVEEIRSGNGSLQYTVKDRLPDGSLATLDMTAYIIRDNAGEEIIWFFAHDISLRERHKNKIRELNRVMDAILNNVPLYLFVKNPADDFRYLYWNKAFEEHSGIPARDVLGKTDFEVFPNRQDAEKFRRDDLNLLATGERIEFQEEYVAVNGKHRTVKTSKALIPTENEVPLLIGVSWDITDLKNSEKELIAARMKAEQSDRLKSIFLANMSHEIRTPLNAIVGFSRLIVTEDDPSERRQYSDIIDTNAELLLQLINDILDLSKIEAGTLEFIDRPMDLAELCRNTYEIHKTRVREGVELIYDERYPELKMIGDQNRIAQVITNLITNAIKFTAQGEIRFGFDLCDGAVDFYVKDTGTGIPKEMIDRIFDRFTKLDNFVQGTGLGLAISRMIVEKLEGNIGVESQQGVGSTFRFSIPYKPCGMPIRPDSVIAAGRKEAPVRHKTILVAEDIDSNYLLIQAFLRKNYRCIRAHDGREAIKLYKEHHPDLILMDIKMPNMNGLEATRVIRTISRSVPIIALTAFAFESDKAEALRAGCNDFLSKPLSRDALEKTFGRYLRR